MKIIDYKNSLEDSYRKNKRTFIFYLVLRALVILTLVRCILTGNYESAMLCVLSLLLFLVPAFLQSKMRIEIPAVFQVIIFGFIYAAEILGEVNHYYVKVQGWDTMLHTMNGFLCAAIGSVTLDPNNSGIPFIISDITDTVVNTADGKTYIIAGGYLDIGIIDTIKDLLVNLVGAVAFSIIGYSTLKFSKKSVIAENLMIKPME